MYPTDPVNIAPIPPLQDSYSYHSEPHSGDPEEEWIMGIDEAGRGRESLALSWFMVCDTDFRSCARYVPTGNQGMDMALVQEY